MKPTTTYGRKSSERRARNQDISHILDGDPYHPNSSARPVFSSKRQRISVENTNSNTLPSHAPLDILGIASTGKEDCASTVVSVGKSHSSAGKASSRDHPVDADASPHVPLITASSSIAIRRPNSSYLLRQDHDLADEEEDQDVTTPNRIVKDSLFSKRSHRIEGSAKATASQRKAISAKFYTLSRAESGLSVKSRTPSPPYLPDRTTSLPALPAPINITDPSTPKKSAKMLSKIFDASFSAVSQAAVSSGGKSNAPGIAKRMLSRSRTESSLDGGSTNTSLNSMSTSLLRKDSTIIGPSVESARGDASLSTKRFLTPTKSLPYYSAEDGPSPTNSPSQRNTAFTTTRTYAGKSRSFLVELPTSHVPSASGNTYSPPGDGDENAAETRESYADLRTRWGVDNSEDDPRPHSPSISPGKGKGKGKDILTVSLPGGMMNDLKSITELRSRGESRRFLDEVGYLFEGLESRGAVSVRRASGLEIVSKLCDADFSRKAKAADFLGRTWDKLRNAGAGNGDKILDITLVFFAALVARDSSSLTELVNKSDFVDTLFNILSAINRSRDILNLIAIAPHDVNLKKAGVAKTEKSLLVQLHKMASEKSGIFHGGVTVSTRTLVSFTLSALPPCTLPTSLMPILCHSLKSELSTIPPRVVAYISGLPLLPPSSCSQLPSFTHIEYCLRLLDSFLLGQWSQDNHRDPSGEETLDNSQVEETSDSLVALCVAAEVQSRDSNDVDGQVVLYNCLEVALRVLVNVSHGNTSWCQKLIQNKFTLPLIMRIIALAHRERSSLFAKSEEQSQPLFEDDHEARSLDRLCLALGLLTNLVQVAGQAKEHLREIRIDPSCEAKHDCVNACHCLHRTNALEYLVTVYLQQLKADDPGSNFLRGHLAVLFGLLMRRCQANQKILLHALPGTSSRQKLNSLVDQAHEFVIFYTQLTDRLAIAAKGETGGFDPQISSPHLREHGVEMFRDSKGEGVARDIVNFLQRLCDQYD